MKPIVGDNQWIITSKEMIDYFRLYVTSYDEIKSSSEARIIEEPISKNTAINNLERRIR